MVEFRTPFCLPVVPALPPPRQGIAGQSKGVQGESSCTVPELLSSPSPATDVDHLHLGEQMKHWILKEV